jgi:uncharacterized membrane protein YphA (DoxX/SURF4 family)
MSVKHYINTLEAPTSIAPLITLRVVVGALLLFSTARFWWLGWIDDHYVQPITRFHYYGLDWIKPLPEFGLYAVHAALMLCSLLVLLGLFYRLAAIGQFVLFTYTELIDLTYYLNHYYFVSIACALLILVPANRNGSMDAWLYPTIRTSMVPRWTIEVFKWQLGIVYFYAGIWKINSDWLLHALPLKIWLPAQDQIPLAGPWMRLPETAYVFSWAGMLYDTSIPFWLSWHKTRPYAFLVVVLFHVMTGVLFAIGVFPAVMIGMTLVFFSPAWHKGWQKPILGDVRQEAASRWPRSNLQRKGILLFLGAHIVFQVLFPWRYLLYPGNVFWTEEGYRFSWRVMLMEKAGTAHFFVKDTQSGREGVVVNSAFLNPHQEKQMAMQPDMILQFAHFLTEHYAQKGVHQPEVRAEVYVTLNGRPSQLLINPQTNLSALRDGWKHKDWILRYD